MNRTTVALALIAAFAACGKSKPQPTTPIANTGPAESSPLGGDAYGGDAYGGDDMYGGDMYGGVLGGEEGGEVGGVVGGMVGGMPQVVIAGRWVGPCAGDKKAGFTRATFDLTAGDWDLHNEVFADAACTKRRSSTHLGGSYVSPDQSTIAGAWNVQFDLLRRDVTADDKKTAAALGKTCGVKLAVGVATDIHTAGCPKLGLRPVADCAREFDVFAVTGGLLHFGQRPADNDVCSVTRRPTALSTVELTWRWTPSGVPECDALGAQYEKLLACTSSQMTVEVKNGIREGLGTMGATWAQAASTPEARQAMVDACKAGEQAIVQAMPSMGC